MISTEYLYLLGIIASWLYSIVWTGSNWGFCISLKYVLFLCNALSCPFFLSLNAEPHGHREQSNKILLKIFYKCMQPWDRSKPKHQHTEGMSHFHFPIIHDFPRLKNIRFLKYLLYLTSLLLRSVESVQLFLTSSINALLFFILFKCNLVTNSVFFLGKRIGRHHFSPVLEKTPFTRKLSHYFHLHFLFISNLLSPTLSLAFQC